MQRRKNAEPLRQGSESATSSLLLIPGLPNDLALSVLVRLPPFVQARLRRVCRSWKHSMEPAAMSSIRKMLHVPEVWLISLCCGPRWHNRFLFALVDPFSRRTRRIGRPTRFLAQGSLLEFRYFGIVGHEVLISVKWKCAPSVKFPDLEGLYSFDVACMKWNYLRYASLPKGIRVCATDMNSNCLYAGGNFVVERLDLKTNMWEVLPDPHVKRHEYTAVVLQNSFCMLGGRDKNNVQCNSGEIWNPASQIWTLLPDLWPPIMVSDMFTCEMSNVVVLVDRLYVVRLSTSSPELMYFDTCCKSWISLGYAPMYNLGYRRRNCLFAMDRELWLIDMGHLTIWATKPSVSQPLSWRELPVCPTPYRFCTYLGAVLV